jgi:hypothetical protein
MKFLIGALLGAAAGYFVFYKLIGCANGSCPITSNKYVSTIYGTILGLLLAAGF